MQIKRSHTFFIIVLALTQIMLSPLVRAQDGVEFVFSYPLGPDKKGKPQPPAKIVCWLPKGCQYVRGIVVAHPMIAPATTSPLVRKVAADEGLGTMVMPAFAKSGKETMERLDTIFDLWAKASEHPEIRGAAVLTAGLSASVLWARNVGYGAPDRVFGILHVAGGNLHQEMNDERKTLSGIPFMAVNGELEVFGPEGGIRPHLGLETQWYLMGNTMLERRKVDPDNLMSLVVIPCKGHTAWNIELAALFIRKAAQYRLPKEKRDGSIPARCIPLKAEDGWLTDRNVKYPKNEPAAWADYKGDKTEAFWQFDKEMALAVCKYHKDGIRSGQERTLFRPEGLFESLWPLGELMDIPFKGNTPNEYAEILREWIGKKTGNSIDTGIVRCLADGIAGGLKKDKEGKTIDVAICREMCQRVCYAYNDAYLPIEEVIGKTKLSSGSKALLRTYYAKHMLVLWPDGNAIPELPIRAVMAWIAALPHHLVTNEINVMLQNIRFSKCSAIASLYGRVPDNRAAGMDKWLLDLRDKDPGIGGSAVDELVKLGASAIPELVRTMDYAGYPADFRAAVALGHMGKAASCALPDLRRNTVRGGISEKNATLSPKALEAITEIEKEAR